MCRPRHLTEGAQGITQSLATSPFVALQCDVNKAWILVNGVPLRYWGTLNSRRATSLLVRLVEGEERWETPDHPQGALPQNWGGVEPSHTVICMVLKAAENDKSKSSPLPWMNFRKP
ncbi:uncharacterized protein TNCV_4754851 [Trichonephila clavipes]|nr:uncharacterized protein TNCV_4754851 [Trichonephila clavipes]